jgi:amino acid adenylation domain-containing protein
MTTVADTGREYWRDVLGAGGATVVPRWTRSPVPGTAEHEIPLPPDSVAALRRLAAGLHVPLRTVLLAAHAAVLAALSGERDVVTAYVPEDGGRLLPCRLATDLPSWRSLIAETHRREALLLAHADIPVDDVADDLGLPVPRFEAVFDPAGAGGGPDAVVAVSFPSRGDSLLVRVVHRTDAIDGHCAARIAGYHRRALGLMTADPDAPHRAGDLLAADEVRLQLEDLAGPRRELPDRRVHELFQEHARTHPDAIAGVHRDRRWTYGELNARANRLARALLARGVRREEIVAVVMERDLDWMAAVLAVFKAGAAYLPLEPHFPAGRIGRALTRAECRLVVTERGSTATLEEALDTLPGIRTMDVEEAYAEAHADADLGIEVAADQLAYVLFTSGSTGEPKGAMCEHAGMLNHIGAKLGDLRVGAGDVVAQNGPQCFDVSVWQLVGALTVGGSTLIVDQDVILDIERFVDTIVEGRATTLQVVPSYLDVLVTYLERHPRRLPDLRTVCPTGDFLKKELVQRWFAVQPGIPLVNTYGLTETSDDAVHAVMEQVPDGDRVPLGRPIQNVRVYVADEDLRPVPLGAPGLIVFSGVCVGRGYVNDPERTRQLFGTDPHVPGARVCRTGDYGRWMPDGTLDFLGRRDNQVKIRGFRIEIGDIENALLRVPGVRDGAVVVAERPDRTRYLVAFCAGPGPLAGDVVRERLGALLPEYMVPAVVLWRDGLPLTPNGKIDRTALTGIAAEESQESRGDAPETATERRLAAAWATVLGVPADSIGRTDSFFDRGGTSLSSVKLAIALDRAVSPADLVRRPVLADLAALVDERSAAPDPARTTGAAPRPVEAAVPS